MADRDREEGSTTVEFALLVAVLILAVLAPVQVALWWHARQAADLAVEEALDAAQLTTATAADGETAAHEVLSQVGSLREATVRVTRSATTVTAEVRGRAAQLLLVGPRWPVAVRATAPVERFIAQPQRQR